MQGRRNGFQGRVSEALLAGFQLGYAGSGRPDERGKLLLRVTTELAPLLEKVAGLGFFEIGFYLDHASFC